MYSLAGGLVMLAAVIGIYVAGPGGADGFLLDNLAGLEVGTTAGRWLFLGLFVAFAVKAPLWPVHTWLPDAAAQAPPGAAVLLVGVLDKVGTFGMLTILLPLFPEASRWAAPVIIILALVSIIYGALRRAGPEGRHAAHRVDVDQPLRLHRAGHLRHDHDRARAAPRSTRSTTASPRPRCSWSPACSPPVAAPA